MGLGLRLRVTNGRDGSMIERTFDRFPVRIGRNPLNDLQLDFPYVSQFHAVLERHGRQLMLRDLGSKNGTQLRNTGKVQPHQLLDLGPSNYEFAVSSLHFQAFPAEVQQAPAAPARMRGATFMMDAPIAATINDAAAGGSNALAEAEKQLKPFYDAYRTAWAQTYEQLCRHIAAVPAHLRAQFFTQLSTTMPAMVGEADFQRVANVAQAKVAAVPKAHGTRDEMMALQAVKDLAQSYVAGRPMEGNADVFLFLAKVQSTLDVFFKSFIPLRDGYKQFETKMDIKRTMRAGQEHSTAGMSVATVETAKDPRMLGARLLDWKDPSNEGPRQIESIFADLMIHQVAMLDGVMRGVKSLLMELSPGAIEALLEKKKTGGFKLGPFRYEALWKLYGERHSDLADEEKEAFGLIFGPQFVQAYTQFSGESMGRGGGGGGSTGTATPYSPQPNPSGQSGQMPRVGESAFPPPWRPPER